VIGAISAISIPSVHFFCKFNHSIGRRAKHLNRKEHRERREFSVFTRLSGLGFRVVGWKGLEAIRVIRPLLRLIRVPGDAGSGTSRRENWVHIERNTSKR
jgi:hypothetical protein